MNRRVYVSASLRVNVRVPNAAQPRWTPERRLRVALANNNKGIWWACLSDRSVADLERKFQEGSVARLLYDVTGGILGDHRVLTHGGGKSYLFVQLQRLDGDVLACLDEINVKPVGPVAWSEAIRHP